jgi:hypothetical protein
MAHQPLPPFLAGALQSVGITSAFVAFGLASAGFFSLYNGRVTESEQPAIWLVDGFNVLHAGVLEGRERGDWWRAASRAQLLALAGSFDDPEAELWIVFDGPHPAPATPASGAPPIPLGSAWSPETAAWQSAPAAAVPR